MKNKKRTDFSEKELKKILELKDKFFELKCDMQSLLRELYSFGIVYDSEDYTDTLSMNIGEISISSGSYYGELEINDKDDYSGGGDIAQTENNYTLINKIYDEMLKRKEELFKPNTTKLGLKELAKKIFDKPLPFKVDVEKYDNEEFERRRKILSYYPPKK